jgi:uncharacterized protein with HEPN domain
MLEKDLLNLHDMKTSIEKIILYTDGVKNADEFKLDIRTYDAVLMNFIVIGEAVSRLSLAFSTKYNYIEWSVIKSFRNIVAHDYKGIDDDITWQIIVNKLPLLKQDLTDIITELTHE